MFSYTLLYEVRFFIQLSISRFQLSHRLLVVERNTSHLLDCLVLFWLSHSKCGEEIELPVPLSYILSMNASHFLGCQIPNLRMC